MEAFAHSITEHAVETQLHLSNSNAPQVTTLSLVQPQFTHEVVQNVAPVNKNFVPGLFPETLSKFDDEQDPLIKIDIVRAFLAIFYSERGNFNSNTQIQRVYQKGKAI
jgi:hypothetical protein